MTVHCTVAVLLGIFASPASAQKKPADPVQAYNIAVKSIGSKNWDPGLKAVNAVISEYGGNKGMKQFGPAFGHFYYLRGLLQIGKKQYSPARDSFKICYENYKNKDLGKSEFGEDKPQPNIFRNAALVQWANIDMHEKQWASAVTLYKKAMKEGVEDPNVNMIYIRVNLGKCLLKSGDIDGGFKFISPALDSGNASEGLKQVIFMILSEDWSTEVKLPPVREFISKYRSIVSLDDPEDRYKRNYKFQELAQTASKENDPIRALAWYSLMIDPIDRLPAIDGEIEELKARKVAPEMEMKKNQFIAKLDKQRNKSVRESWQLLNGSGNAYFQMKNFSASYAVFGKLSNDVPETFADRPVYLHNAVVSAARINKWKEAYHYGKIFLDAYPDHELMHSVARVLVEIIFLRGEYRESYRISGEVREDMEVGAAIRDIPDFVYGASAFHLEQIEEAEAELEAYVANYPKGERLEPVEFYLGLTKVRLFKWAEAATVLNGFIERYPTSTMLPDALFQCALSEFMIDKVQDSLTKVERLIAEFPNHQTIAKAWNLRGDIFATEERDFADIESSYTQGKTLAYQLQGEEETAAYSLWQLLIHTSEAKMWDVSEEHIAVFREQHAESVYRLDFLVASLPVLVELGRKDDGLKKLREAVYEFGEQPTSVELAEMFGSYLEYLKSNYTKEEISKELEGGSEKAYDMPALKGWYLIGLLDLLTNGEEETEQLKEQENGYYYRLDNNFDPVKNSNYIIVQLARWQAEFRKDPAAARALYDYIIDERPGTANYNYALIDTAELLAKSDKEEDRQEAMTRFERVLREIPDEELKELAILGIARLHTKKKQYVEAQPFWEQYLDNRDWTVSRPEANYEYAACLHQQGKVADAKKIYVSVYANFSGHLDWSTRAYLATAMIVKGEGNDLGAMLVLRDMLKRMGHHDHPGVDQAKKLFVKWRAEYQPDAKKGE